MRRRIIASAVAALSLLSGVGTSTAAAQTTSITHVQAYDKNNVIFLTNATRQQYGLRALRYDWRLQYAAQLHSNYQALIHTMTHVGADGSHGGTRITRAGLIWNSWGENVAAGQTSATQVVHDWMASPSHRANMLNAGFTMIGVGLTVDTRGVWYWTLEFAS